MEFISGFEVFTSILIRFIPVWISLVVIFALSITFKHRLSLYGRIFDSPIGMFGLFLLLFWVLTAVFADQIALFGPRDQIAILRNRLPGVIDPETAKVYLLGADNLGRDVFSRVVYGSRTVMQIAPAATLLAFMVGITLGLPAGYYGGLFDTILSFVANLVLAFPVILLFYLLVTDEIRQTAIPTTMAAVLFLMPLLFVGIFIHSRYSTRPQIVLFVLLPVLAVGTFFYLQFSGLWTPMGQWMSANVLNIFVAVVFVNSPTVFRIVRGLTMDIKTRDYVAAAQTRGERPAYIMLWEILPNARGPLIVDACLRIGYTTILLGTLGFFGLGVDPESADWGMNINEGRKLFLRRIYHPAIPPAVAIMTLVLGLNLLADSLREQSLKD